MERAVARGVMRRVSEMMGSGRPTPPARPDQFVAIIGIIRVSEGR